MDTKTGRLRELSEGESPKPGEVLVNKPRPDCPRCKGAGSIPREETNRAERRRAEKAGVPAGAYLPCPECNPEGADSAHILRR